MTPFERRIAALETANAQKAFVRVPSVMRVPFGQTITQARETFEATYGPRSGFNVLWVPAKPSTEAECQIFAEKFLAGQSRLVAEACRECVNAPIIIPATPRSSFPPGIPAPPKGRALVKWKALLS